MFPLDQIPAIQANPQNYRLLQEVSSLPRPGGDSMSLTNLSPFAIVDVETTGLSHHTDAVTEFGMVWGQYYKDTLEIASIGNPRSWFQDPGVPIPEEVVRKTKITDEMVAGKCIPWDDVEPWFQSRPLIIAHNAGFDRPFCENMSDVFKSAPWCCTYRGLDWETHGAEPGKLEYLAFQHGIFYGSHRAGTDCLALAHILKRNQSAFAELVANARKPSVQIDAYGYPYDHKDLLKARGWNWQDDSHGIRKRWWADVFVDRVEDEKAFLNQVPGYNSSRCTYTDKTAFTRFKAVV